MFHDSNKIAPSVIINGNIKIGKNNVICDNVIFTGNIIIGDDNYIGPSCIFDNQVEIGNNNTLMGHCSVGTQGEMGSQGDRIPDSGKVLIGNSNVFREFITINFPVFEELTQIGDKCYFMARTHLPHDCKVNNRVTMATNSLIGGHCVVQDYAYIGLGSMTHQNINIGECSMIGMLSANVKHVPPFSVVTGVPSKILKFNRVGAERRSIDNNIIKEVETNFRPIILGEYESDNPIVKKIMTFIKDNPLIISSFKE